MKEEREHEEMKEEREHGGRARARVGERAGEKEHVQNERVSGEEGE